MILIAPLVYLVCFVLLARLTVVVARRQTLQRAVLVGLLWPWLWAAPASLVQALRMGEDGLESVLFLTLGWLIAVGGHSVTLLFEANVGDRQSTLADNFDFYLLFWFAQLALCSFAGMLRFRAAGRLRDKWLLLLGIAVSANALLNVSWPWWGT